MESYMSDQISVSVGLSAKVSNPQNRFENSTFSRNLTRTITIAAIPDDPDTDPSKVVEYEKFVTETLGAVEKNLKGLVEAQVQAEIDQFFDENSE